MCSEDGCDHVSINILTQASLRYQHLRENHPESLQQGIIHQVKNSKRSPKC